MDMRGIFLKIYKYVMGLVFVGLSAAGIILIVPHYHRQNEIKRANEELQAKIDLKKREIAVLLENQRRFRNDADFVEMIARQNHRVFPGELVFIFEKD